MKMWIDADAAPRDVKEVVFRAAKRLSIDTILVANGPIQTPANATTVSTIIVRQGANVADQYITDRSVPGDIAVTADIPLAALLVEKGLYVIDPRGDVFDCDNIKSRLATRDFFESVRSSGIQTAGAGPYSDQHKKAFADSLDRALARAIAAEKRRLKVEENSSAEGQ